MSLSIVSTAISTHPRRTKPRSSGRRAGHTRQAREERTITYKQLHREVCQFANCSSETVSSAATARLIYLPMVPEAAVAMLACARIGPCIPCVRRIQRAIGCGPHSRFAATNWSSPRTAGAVAARLCRSKKNVDEALTHQDESGNLLAEKDEKVIVLRRATTRSASPRAPMVWWIRDWSTWTRMFQAEKMDSEAPLFIFTPAGSTG